MFCFPISVEASVPNNNILNRKKCNNKTCHHFDYPLGTMGVNKAFDRKLSRCLFSSLPKGYGQFPLGCLTLFLGFKEWHFIKTAIAGVIVVRHKENWKLSGSELVKAIQIL